MLKARFSVGCLEVAWRQRVPHAHHAEPSIIHRAGGMDPMCSYDDESRFATLHVEATFS